MRYYVWNKARLQNVCQRAILRMSQRRQATAFRGWIEAIGNREYDELLQSSEAAGRELEKLRSENVKLRRDNERFVRLIDSGEWGRGRVEELKQAGEVLRSERDALHNLVRDLKRDLEDVGRSKANQETELRKFKDKLAAGGSSTAAGRNKLLVKGASSFNALVRALKQDLIDNRPHSPERGVLALEVDKMSMDKVHVFPDGELKIEAVRKKDGADHR